jgi:predicted MPP superfamily phosphohydrolase
MVVAGLMVILVVGLSMGYYRIAALVPNAVSAVLQTLGLVLGAIILGPRVLWWIWEAIPFHPERREVLKLASVAAPAVVLGAAFVERENLKLREIMIPIPGLPKDLDGLRIVQISDLHLSPLVNESLVARAVDLANSLKPHLTVVTGDLISRRGDPLDACLKQIGRLRADNAILGCMGNHEIYAESEEYTKDEAARLGIEFLRHEHRIVQFGNARINFAGVDYQSKRVGPYLVGAEKLVVPGTLNVLLSHNPDVFPVAAKQGFALTLAGHTHGGQVRMEILKQNLNVARFYTPYVDGLYSEGDSSVFVTRGIGTVGLPARLGAPPEVALIKLCAIS